MGQDRVKGARPRVPADSNSDEWNQPRCWSEPSKYNAAGQDRSLRPSSTKLWVEPFQTRRLRCR